MLQPLNLRPAAEAPVDPNQLCLVAPADAEWTIGYRNDEGWWDTDGMPLEPLLYVALPPAPGRTSPPMMANLSRFIAELLGDGEYARAAKLIDELADRVRKVRDAG